MLTVSLVVLGTWQDTQLIEEFVPRTTAWTVFPRVPDLQILGIERSISEQPHSGPLGWAGLGQSVLHKSLANLQQLLNGIILELWLRWAQAVMAGSPSNSHSDNYTGFKLFSTLHPQSNFRINLRFDRELVAVSRRPGIACWACLVLVIIPVAGPTHLRSRALSSVATQGRKSINQSIRAHLIKGNKGSGHLSPPRSVRPVER